MTISITPRETLIMPAGKYYVGDLCYLLPDDIYDKYVSGFEDDKAVSIKAGRRKDFVAFFGNAAYGDGEYTDNEGNKYSVDAGILGVVQLVSADFIAKAKEQEEHAKIIDFPEDFRVDRDEDGTFTFGHLTIVTDGSDQEDDEYDWDDEEDESDWDEDELRIREEDEYNNHY